jgi:hypothetical protein
MSNKCKGVKYSLVGKKRQNLLILPCLKEVVRVGALTGKPLGCFTHREGRYECLIFEHPTVQKLVSTTAKYYKSIRKYKLLLANKT